MISLTSRYLHLTNAIALFLLFHSMSIFRYVNSLFKPKRQDRKSIEQIQGLLVQPKVEEASFDTTTSDETHDHQSSRISPRVLQARFNDDNLSLMMSPRNMSSATLNMSSSIASHHKGTGHRGSSHHQERTSRKSLKQKLREARISCCERSHTFFIPLNKQRDLITLSAIEDAIRREDSEGICHNPNKCARWTYQNAKQLFTILAYMGKGGAWIYQMYRDRITDEILPLEAEVEGTGGTIPVRLRRKTDRTIIESFDDWDSEDLETFVRIQWWVLVPKFDRHNLACRYFPSETVLPLMGVKKVGAPDEVVPHVKLGGFSEVTAYRIHSSHHNFWHLNTIPEVDHPRVVIKTLLDTDNEQEYEKERSILVKLGPYNHSHLIKLYATYRFDNHYHFIFPCAKCNLRNFWEMRKNPVFDRATLLWSLKQMCGLASALSLIHNFRTTVDLKPSGGVLHNEDSRLEVTKGEEKFGRHGDIKPENILWFKEEDEAGVLRITDFGLGRFHGRDSRSNVDPRTVNATPTYEPPECKLGRPVSRKYDIWSVACLYLEFATWLLEGTEAIHEFGDARGERGESSLIINNLEYTIVRDSIINDDNFFTILSDNSGSRSAVVREAVLQWVKRLHRHKNCSNMLHDLLDLVMGHLLLPYSQQRLDAKLLNKKMDEIFDRAYSDPGYLMKPNPKASSRLSLLPTVSKRCQPGKVLRFAEKAETWPTTSPT